MNDTAKQAYAARIEKVFDYIEHHLDQVLTVEQPSELANFSKYHFHRQFSEFTGINVFRLVQLMRLKRALYQLVFNPQHRIIEIALNARFENPESFSRAFKKHLDKRPRNFATILPGNLA